MPYAPVQQLVTIPPGRHFHATGCTDSHEAQARAVNTKPDVIGLDSAAREPILPLADLDRLPALLEGTEVPALAVRTDDPEPSACLIERELPADWKLLDDEIRAEPAFAEDAVCVDIRTS